MTARSCQNCKHYEPSAMWRRGWCRNPRLYSPQQSHMVDQDSLDCSRGLGSAWEPADDADRQGSASIGRQPLRLFAPQPRLAVAGAGAGHSVMASSDVGGGSTGGGGSFSGPPRSERTAAPVGQERTVSYQPEERYWTDYLRIALPVIGLLLLLGLFWWWGSNLIGGGSEDEPATQVADAVINEVGASPAPPTATVPAQGLTPATGAPPASPTAPAAAAQDEEPAEVAASAPTEPAEEAPPQEAAEDAPESNPGSNAIPPRQVDSTAVVADTTNVRSEASTSSDVVVELPAGSTVTITGDQVSDADGELNEWYPILTEEGEEGFIREDLFETE